MYMNKHWEWIGVTKSRFHMVIFRGEVINCIDDKVAF